MASPRLRAALSHFLSDYGMLLVLLLLCGYYSYATWDEQHPVTPRAAEQLARDIAQRFGPDAHVLIVAGDNPQQAGFADVLRKRLGAARVVVVGVVKGQPADARLALEGLVATRTRLDAVAANHVTAAWPVFDDLGRRFPALASVPVLTPRSYHWPNFLKTGNLLNVVDQIVVIAILAVGMTMVIITGGIDLSVGSLIALSAVVATLLIRGAAGAEQATALGMVLCCLAGIAACGLMGGLSGVMVTAFAVPPFIATLGMMLVASGLAYLLAQGQSIYQVPASFVWLGRGVAAFGIPNAVVLMAAIYAASHLLMTRVPLGRYIYAVGGNAEAARLSGVRVERVKLFAYTACGALAGLGGIVMASQLRSGSPTYGLMYELYSIAAVVVGGTSLAGGQGKILGTLIGAFIIAVIQNGMNLTGVESYTQKVVLGLVILGAVLLDRLKRRGTRFFMPKAKAQG